MKYLGCDKDAYLNTSDSGHDIIMRGSARHKLYQETFIKGIFFKKKRLLLRG